MTKEQHPERCQNCKYPLELYEIDGRKNTKTMKCERCGLLHHFKKDLVGNWRMQIATRAWLVGKRDLLSDLMISAKFLELDTNWALATSALQLQEVAVKLFAGRKGITLDKANVEKILKRRIKGELSFNDSYEAFVKQVKDLYKLEMPILASHLRRMRVKVMHEGYNPQPEETELLVAFTIGLLQRMEKAQ